MLDIYERFRKAYRNPLSVMWNLYRRKDIIHVVLMDRSQEKLSPGATSGLSILIEKGIIINKMTLNEFKKLTETEWKDLWHLIANGIEFTKAMDIMKSIVEIRYNEKIPYKNNVIIMHGLKDNGDLIDVFIWEDYSFLNVSGKVVVDLGANIGDSAIYFALNGAKKVIALEPFPYSFNLAVRNVRENNLEDKIEILNAGYGRDGYIFVDSDYANGLGTILKISKKGEKIKIYSLKSLVEKFKLNDAVLKMDCEGCEYNLLNEDNSVIVKFSQIQIEYHNGYKKLIEKLNNAGFSVECIKRDESEIFGHIHASKH